MQSMKPVRTPDGGLISWTLAAALNCDFLPSEVRDSMAVTAKVRLDEWRSERWVDGSSTRIVLSESCNQHYTDVHSQHSAVNHLSSGQSIP